MSVYHPRLGRNVQLSDAHQFMAQQRTHVTEAFAGDIVGLYDTGTFRIGDTLTKGAPKDTTYNELRRFSPEHFARVRTQKALRRKQLEKGLLHLAEEGTIQVFRSVASGMVEPIVGAVGVLQFEVLKYRLKAEYGVEARLETLPYTCARWVKGEFDPTRFEGRESTSCVVDRDENPLILLRNEWALQWIKNDYPGIEFFAYAPDGIGVV